MMKKILFSGIIITVLLKQSAWGASVAGSVEKGNRLYRNQKYEDALGHYDQALAKQPDSAVINFDVGAAQYKTKEYEQANRSFEKSLMSEDKNLEAKANYNLGNSKYMQGLAQENTDLSGAVRLLEGALGNYKRTQELTPKDEDVKVNYKIVEAKLKELKEKLKQQPQKNQENKDNQKQDQQSQEGQSQPQKPGASQPKEQQQSGQSESLESKESKEKSEQRQSASQEEEKDKSQDQSEQKQQAQQSGQEGQPKQDQSAAGEQGQEPKEMSKEEASMLLEGYRQEEDAGGMLQDKQQGTEDKVLKDW